MDLRELKALELAARCKITWDGDHWTVPSQRGSVKYKVTLKPESCTCDDFALRGPVQPCKHVLAARLVQERDHGGKAPKLDTNTVPKKPTYPRNWAVYDLAQTTEKHRFQELLLDLCRGIEEPPPAKTGRRPHLYRDAVFAMCYKVYCFVSARRFHCDLQDAHGQGYLTRPIHGVKVCAFMEDDELTPVLSDLIVQSSLPLTAVETTFVPDSSGFSSSRFVRWYDEKYGIEKSGYDWVKAHVMTGVKTNIITAVEIHDRDAADSPQFRPLTETTAKNFTIKEVPADKAYLSRENLELIDSLGGTAYVPFKSNSIPGEPDTLWQRMYHFFHYHRAEFLRHYHQRSLVESTFSMVKAKFGDSIRSKTDTAMKNEVLCKLLAHNICCVIMSQLELGIETTFWPEQASDRPNVLPMVQPG